ncbi:MAG: hypothetical protein ACHQ4H_06540 [Ktedonobacterales bacterium]
MQANPRDHFVARRDQAAADHITTNTAMRGSGYGWVAGLVLVVVGTIFIL